MICAVVVEMSPMQSRHDQLQGFAPHFEADEYDFAPRFEADDDADDDSDADSALADAKAAEKKAKKAAKKAAAEAKAAKEAKEEQKEEEEEEQEEENEDATEAANETAVVPTIGDDFLNVDPIPSDSSEFNDIASSGVDKPVKPKENENNTYDGCYDGWKQYPCNRGFRHGCEKGICWSQCNSVAAALFGVGAEWCWVYETKASNVTGTADDSDWKYLGCKTDDDCTKQFAYRQKCTGGCSLG